MTEMPPLPEIPANHCQKCPTLGGYLYGHDPESYDLLLSESWCLQEQAEREGLWCPWRQANCVVYPVELEWAIACHAAGIKPPIKLDPQFSLNDSGHTWQVGDRLQLGDKHAQVTQHDPDREQLVVTGTDLTVMHSSQPEMAALGWHRVNKPSLREHHD